MNVQRLIEKYKELEAGSFDIAAIVVCQLVLKDLEQLDELEKVQIPQFVAEIIEYYKGNNATLYDALREKNFNKQYNEWLMNEQDAYNKVARAWLDGYEVEEEKRYLVKIKAVDQYLVRVKDEDFLGFLQSRLRSNFTRKELEEAGFGWVFDCEGIEIEEVE
ncbi:DUF1642 domain-containing protein [uncultured Streptococcus sp.]|uniref:DUF1642 domain-containing protein n=1 Tax=uncultured Streptococcus sp. TaxID=83427 RepID=UPI00288A0D77|nr:DUF1642 domain-containing protein [uncultured Streptococcus sp.]